MKTYNSIEKNRKGVPTFSEETKKESLEYDLEVLKDLRGWRLDEVKE